MVLIINLHLLLQNENIYCPFEKRNKQELRSKSCDLPTRLSTLSCDPSFAPVIITK